MGEDSAFSKVNILTDRRQKKNKNDRRIKKLQSQIWTVLHTYTVYAYFTLTSTVSGFSSVLHYSKNG